MAGTYRQLPNGKYELCISLKSDLAGKRIRKYKYVEAVGVREVERKLAEFVAENSATDYSSLEKMKLEDFTKKWLIDYAEQHLRDKTISRYKSLLKRINFALGHKRLCDLKPTHLLEFYEMLGQDGIREDKIKITVKKTNESKLIKKSGGLSEKTIRHHHALISSILATAVEWQILKENICERIKAPKVTKKEKKIITIDEAINLLIALDNEEKKYKVMVLIAIFTGFRRGEIMGLEWKDFDYNNGTIQAVRSSLYTKEKGIYTDILKTDKSKRASSIPVPIINEILEYKKEWDNQRLKCGSKWIDTDRLFVQWNGLPMHPDTISQWFPEFIRGHELPHVTLHGLRHAHGSILLAMGMDLESVAEQLGHSNIQMLVNVYGHNVKKENHLVADIMEKALLSKKPSNTSKIVPLRKVAE